MRAETREALQLFVEKAELLSARSFMDRVRTDGFGISGRLGEGPPPMRKRVVDPEAMDACLLTMRLFVQEKERLSFAALRKLAAADDGLSRGWRDQFEYYQSAFDETLDAWCFLVIDGVRLTVREVFETFLYGDKVHTNRDKQQRLDGWRKDADIFAYLEMRFTLTMVDLHQVIALVAAITKRELRGEPIAPLVR